MTHPATTAPRTPPALAACALRVDVGGVPAVEGLSVETSGDHVLVLGAARALFEAAAGLRATASGELRIGGAPASQAVKRGIATGAPLDPPLPPRWTVLEYVTWSARISGHAANAARTHARRALEAMQLSGFEGTKLQAASLGVRRGTVVAAALATGVELLLLDDPLASQPAFPDPTAQVFARVLARALADRRTIIFAPAVALSCPLALGADEALVLDGSQVVARGTPVDLASKETLLALRVTGDVAAFARAIEDRGGSVEVTASAPPPVHVRVELGPLAARDLLQIAIEARAIVLELRPISRAFA